MEKERTVRREERKKRKGRKGKEWKTAEGVGEKFRVGRNSVMWSI